MVSTKEPFQCLVNQGMILGEVCQRFCVLTFLMHFWKVCDQCRSSSAQVEYTTYRNADGVIVSAEAADNLCRPERVSEADVSVVVNVWRPAWALGVRQA